MNHDAPICTQEAAHAAGLDVAPSPSELAAMAEAIVRTWGDRSAEPEDEVGSTADAGAQLARALPLVLAELERIRAERDAFADRVDTLTAIAKGNKRHVQDMYDQVQKVNRERDELKTWHDNYVKGTKFAGREMRRRLITAEADRDASGHYPGDL
ncbi:hypothetical protein [Streptomyces nigrescens]